MRTRRAGFREALEYLADRTGIAAAPLPDAPARGDTPTGRLWPAPRTGLDGWVAHSSQLLWEPYGEPVRHWLTNERGLPEVVLQLHEIGATGITTDDRSIDGVYEGPRSADRAAVLPVAARGCAIHAELHRIDVRDGHPVYASVGQPSGPRPSLGLYRPPQRLHPEILITNGIMDALSANAAGYRAAAVLAPSHDDAEAETAVFLSRLQGPLVIAMGSNRSNEPAINGLANHLWARGRRPALLAELSHDLNDHLVAANDWPRQLAAHVRHAVASGPADRVPEI